MMLSRTTLSRLQPLELQWSTLLQFIYSIWKRKLIARTASKCSLYSLKDKILSRAKISPIIYLLDSGRQILWQNEGKRRRWWRKGEDSEKKRKGKEKQRIRWVYEASTYLVSLLLNCASLISSVTKQHINLPVWVLWTKTME